MVGGIETRGDDMALAVEAQCEVRDEGGADITYPPRRSLAHNILGAGHSGAHLDLDRGGGAPAYQHRARREGERQHHGNGGEQPKPKRHSPPSAEPVLRR